MKQTYSGAHGLYAIEMGRRKEVGRLLGEWADLQELRPSANEEEQMDILDKLFSLRLLIFQKTWGMGELGNIVIAGEEVKRIMVGKEEGRKLTLRDIAFLCPSYGEINWVDSCNELDAIVDRCEALLSKLS